MYKNYTVIVLHMRYIVHLFTPWLELFQGMARRLCLVILHHLDFKDHTEEQFQSTYNKY